MKTKRHPTAPEETVLREYSMFPSEFGELVLVTDGSALTGLYFAGCDHIPAAIKDWARNDRQPVLQTAAQQLKEYFAGRRVRFSIPIRLTGTAFQEKIWREIARIPYGQTIAYTELAGLAGVPQAVRAAGTATGRNPISIIIPCHRVVGKHGEMCGFAGGLDRKRRLLALEGAVTDQATLKLE